MARQKPTLAFERDEAPTDLGARLRAIRSERKLTLTDLAKLTGLSVSALSKIENGKMSPTYDRLAALASGLQMQIAELLEEAPGHAGRRMISRRGGGRRLTTPAYEYEMLCTALVSKRMVPMVTRLKSRTLEEFGPLLRHEGEEFIYVLQGPVIVHTDCYEPVRLETGDSIYIDSRMGHAYLAGGKREAMILGICTQARNPRFPES
jgi:transcriptional regulator with XRE-family HTH domain